jgi:2-dehydro-3-deoxy-D-arabinonate dehydratase
MGKDNRPRLAVEVEDGRLVDLTGANSAVRDFSDLLKAAEDAGTTVDQVARATLRGAKTSEYPLHKLNGNGHSNGNSLRLTRPLDPPEVWAVGVTYKSSEMERRRESTTPDIYARVYGTVTRPEFFFKATAGRCSGPHEPVGIRGDSTWNVPEPELAFILHKGEIAGYTIGNDMSSRSIEGENPLYLPQAKLYDRCCAIGPCIATPETVGNPQELHMECAIFREGEEVFHGKASTAQMSRCVSDLADWLQRHNPVPDMTTVLTGTAIVPPADFTLKPGDVVRITIEKLGTLENTVIEV